jgi:glycosyltransferase involved in cell wall biosynthesis
MKVLQGMALGKAVVTTPLGAEGLTQEAGPPPLALANDVAGLVAAAAALLGDAPARRALGQRARAFVAEHYSTAAYVRRTEAVYRELLAD